MVERKYMKYKTGKRNHLFYRRVLFFFFTNLDLIGGKYFIHAYKYAACMKYFPSIRKYIAVYHLYLYYHMFLYKLFLWNIK